MGERLWLWQFGMRRLPEAAAWQSEEAQHCQQHPEWQQREDVQEGVHAQEEAKDHQLRRKRAHSNSFNSNNSRKKIASWTGLQVGMIKLFQRANVPICAEWKTDVCKLTHLFVFLSSYEDVFRV